MSSRRFVFFESGGALFQCKQAVGPHKKAMNSTEENLLGHIVRRMQADRSIDAPADSRKYAKDLYRTRHTQRDVSRIKKFIAVLTADLAPGRAAFGERSAAGAQARQMLFEAGENAVDLRLTRTAQGFDVRGQVFGPGAESGEVQIKGEKFSNTTMLNDMSGFLMAGVPAGSYELTVSLANCNITVERIIVE